MATYYTAKQGDCLSSIAHQFGFADWRTIYNDPNNADLRNLRPNPNIIYPNDSIYIPDKVPKEVARPTDQEHVFEAKRPKTWLRILVRDGQQAPAGGCKYHLEIDGIPYPDAVLGSDGMLQAKVAADAKSGLLTVWFDEQASVGHTWTLQLGHLDPVKTMSGIQARLSNLGYPCGPVDGIIGPLTQAAVRSFQEDNGLKVDGIPGPITQGKLQDRHGC
jgi:N-acetylmuramoyl-L-alanine amidase